MNTIQLKDIQVWRDEKQILEIKDWRIKSEENWVVLGRNGAGKSTLLNLLYGYYWPTKGTVEILGTKYGETHIAEIREKIGVLEPTHQESRLQRNLSVREILQTGILGTIGLYSSLNLEEENLVEEIISKNSWIPNPNQRFDTLSSGEKKKVLLVRSMIRDPKILLLDEPTSSLDLTAREEFISILENFHRMKNFQTLLITHRTEEIPDFFTHALLLKDGKVLDSGAIADVLTAKNMFLLYDMPLQVNKISGRYYCTPVK